MTPITSRDRSGESELLATNSLEFAFITSGQTHNLLATTIITAVTDGHVFKVKLVGLWYLNSFGVWPHYFITLKLG